MIKSEAFTLLAFLLSDKVMINRKTEKVITKLSDIKGHEISLDHLLNSVERVDHRKAQDYKKNKFSESNYKLACKCLELLLIQEMITKKQCLRFLAIAEITLRPFNNAQLGVRPSKKVIKPSGSVCKRKELIGKTKFKKALKGEALRENSTAIARPKMKSKGKALI